MQESVSMTAGEVPLQNGRGFPIAKALIGIGAVVALLALGSQVGAYVPRFAAEIESLGVWGPVVFILGYAVAVVGFVPGVRPTSRGWASRRRGWPTAARA